MKLLPSSIYFPFGGIDPSHQILWVIQIVMGMKFVMQVVGGDPLLKLIAVDWFTVDKSADRISLHPKCLVQVISISNVLYLLIFVLIIVK